MKKIVISLSLLSSISFASLSNREIANMFILGFYGSKATPNTKIYKDICSRGLGGVILFKKSPVSNRAFKNFNSSSDLKALTKGLKSCGTKPLIAVDQEGGLVQRVKLTYRYPRASLVVKGGKEKARGVYLTMAKELKSLGINLNFAPVADLAINPNNKVIYKWGRSYGKSANTVIDYDRVFINAMHKYNIATSLKHFPGHGSSLGDTHKGFVDVTNLWQNIELKPYMALKNNTDTVMVAHIFNKNYDPVYPASLSKKWISGVLREQIGYRGVVVSDDLQMGAINKHYSLKKRIELSINAGVDIMLFANQLSPKYNLKIEQLVAIVRELLAEGKVTQMQIKNANARINRLKEKLYR